MKLLKAVLIIYVIGASLFSQEQNSESEKWLHESFSPVLENAIRTKNFTNIYMVFRDYYVSKQIYLKSSESAISKDFFEPLGNKTSQIKLDIKKVNSRQYTIGISVIGTNKAVKESIFLTGNKSKDITDTYLKFTLLIQKLSEDER